MNNETLKKLKGRFNDDQKLQVSVLEEPYWSYLLGLYGKTDLWESLLRGIDQEYDGSAEKFLEDFYGVRERMIQDIKESPQWPVFNQPQGRKVYLEEFAHEHFDLAGPFYNVDRGGIKKGDIYNEQSCGKMFLELDLSKANLQALSYFWPGFLTGRGITTGYGAEELWDEWTGKYLTGKPDTLAWYIRESKYLRQVVFGNLNADRQVKLERYLVWNAGLKVTQWLDKEGIGWEYAQLGSDELMLRVERAPDMERLVAEVIAPLQTQPLIPSDPFSSGISVKAGLFTLYGYEFRTPADHAVRVYKKRYLGEDRIEWKKIEKTYRPQIWEILHGIPSDPEEKDLVFTYQKEGNAKFLGRLRLVAENPIDPEDWGVKPGDILSPGKEVVELKSVYRPDGYRDRVVVCTDGKTYNV